MFFGFFSKPVSVTPIDLILFKLVLYCSPVGFDRSHRYPTTILNLAILVIFLNLWVPEPGEGATFEKNFFSDICLSW